MANTNGHRWSKFFWADWQDDPCLRMCSFAAQGLWMRMLCVMHTTSQTGYLLVNGKSPTLRQMVSLCGGSEKEVKQLLGELEGNGVFSRDDKGIIFCRRMVKDAAASDVGKTFAERRWGKHNPNGPPNGSPNGSHGGSPNREPTKEPNAKNLEAEEEKESPPVSPPRGGTPGRRGRRPFRNGFVELIVNEGMPSQAEDHRNHVLAFLEKFHAAGG
jgi:hypothetical protein